MSSARTLRDQIERCYITVTLESPALRPRDFHTETSIAVIELAYHSVPYSMHKLFFSKVCHGEGINVTGPAVASQVRRVRGAQTRLDRGPSRERPYLLFAAIKFNISPTCPPAHVLRVGNQLRFLWMLMRRTPGRHKHACVQTYRDPHSRRLASQNSMVSPSLTTI